jgi:4-hydroxybenzoate polyprenyltransferase
MKWLRFIVSHSIFIAICAAALCFQTAILLQAKLSAWFYSFIFFSTICSYNFYWLLSSYSFVPQKIIFHLRKYYSNSLVLLIAAAGLAVSLAHLIEIVPVIAVAAVLTFLYAVPLLPFKWVQVAKKAGVLKTVLLAFTWAFITVYIPYQYAGTDNPTALYLLFLIRFLFMLMLCIIFDARDTGIDKIRGLQSLTTMLSASAVKLIMFFLFAMFLAAGVLYRVYFNEPLQIAALMVIGAAVAVAYYHSLKKQGYFFYYFFIDGLMLFSALVTFVASI